jgi:hypothetical protein
MPAQSRHLLLVNPYSRTFKLICFVFCRPACLSNPFYAEVPVCYLSSFLMQNFTYFADKSN